MTSTDPPLESAATPDAPGGAPVAESEQTTQIPTPQPAPTNHRITSVVVGAAAAAWDRLSPPARDRIVVREVAVGAVFELEDAVADLFARLHRTRGPVRPRQGA